MKSMINLAGVLANELALDVRTVLGALEEARRVEPKTMIDLAGALANALGADVRKVLGALEDARRAGLTLTWRAA